MKNKNILLTVLLVSVLIGAAFAGARDSDIIDDKSVSSAAAVATSISPIDAIKTEVEIENKFNFDSSAMQTVSKGQGWIVTDGKGALLEILLVSKDGKTSDGTIASVSGGWLKTGNLKLRLESTEITATKKTFSVIGEKDTPIGTFVIIKGSESYQDGFGIWNGDLDLKLDGQSFSAKVKLAIDEKQSGKSDDDQKGTTSQQSYVGAIQLGSMSYMLEGDSRNLKELEFKLRDDNGALGELNLHMVDSTHYTGKIEIKSGLDSNTVIRGEITAELKHDGNTLYGPITIVNEESSSDYSSLEGVIKIDLGASSVSDPNYDGTKKDSGLELQNTNKGLWEKVKEFFGA